MNAKLSSTALLIILLSASLSGLVPLPAVEAQAIPDPRFGVVESYEAPQAASALGVGWTRVTFPWNQIQPDGPDQWNPVPISDAVLNSELARGRQIVGLLVTTPGWATDHDVGPGVPRGLDLPIDHPDNLWAQYVRTIVGRYAGRIDHWTIWNEPDIPGGPHMTWGGSVERFVRLLQVAYTVTKQTNPGAVVHLAGFTHYHDEHWFGRFLDALTAEPHAASNDYYFDVATLHIYFQTELVHDITAHYTNMMRGHGIHKPVWIAETNAAPSRDPAWPVPNAQFDVSLDQQAAYIVQALSLSIVAGAQRVAVYKMADTESDRAANPEPFGLVRLDGSRRPAFTAYRTAATYLAGFRSGTWDRRDDISIVTINRGDQTTTVVWERRGAPQTAMIPARTARALLVDIRGGARTVYADRGYYYIDLPPAICMRGCQIGGLPYMLVEQAPAGSDTAPVPASPTPSPTEPPTEVADPASPTARPTEPPSSPTATASPTDPAPTPSPTATSHATSTATSTVTATPTPTASSTATAAPPSSPTPDPSPSPTPLQASPSAGGRPWILIGALVVGLGGAAVALAHARGRAQDGDAPVQTKPRQ